MEPSGLRCGPLSVGSSVLFTEFCQKSSMLTYAQPWLASSDLSSTSAAPRMSLSVTRPAKQFQLFHPMGGVSAILSPTLTVNMRSSAPREFDALNVMA